MKKIKVGLLGLGRTGRIVAQSFFEDKRFDLVFAVKKTPARLKDFEFVVETKDMLRRLVLDFEPDAIVDFTTPDATLQNVKKLSSGCALVVATTGFNRKQIDQLKRYKRWLKILYAPNISEGINIMFSACSLIKRLWGVDMEIIEQHFANKKDKPSGTALKLAKRLGISREKIHSVRVGNIIGVHEVIFAGANQKIVIRHESLSREVFADGAKRAVRWLVRQHPGFYDVEDWIGR